VTANIDRILTVFRNQIADRPEPPADLARGNAVVVEPSAETPI
jgi:hypothetical protein